MAEIWEFDCPQYVDFNNLSEESDAEADQWFDQSIDAHVEDIEPDSLEDEPDVEEKSQVDEMPEVVSTPVRITRSSKNTPVSVKTPVTNNRTSLSSQSSSKTDRQTPAACQSSIRRTQSARKSVLGKRNHNGSPSPLAVVRQLGQKAKKMFAKANVELTLPLTPQVLKRSLAKFHGEKPKGKTSEELEQEQINYYKKKMAETRDKAEKSVLKAKRNQPMKGTVMCTTVPTEFKFATDDRIKNHSMQTRQDEIKDFVSSLRCNTSNKSVKKLKITKPDPFHFRTDEIVKRKHSASSYDSNKKFKSDAEIMEEFQSGMITRHNDASIASKGSGGEKHLTRPQSPLLMTRNRKRNAIVISSQEQEDKEIEAMKKFKFKANPYDEKLFGSAIGIKKVKKHSPTKQEPFNFESDKLVKKTKPVEEEKYVFHAQPVPAKVLAGPSNTSMHLKKVRLTTPQSPAFALKNRILNKSNVAPPKNDTPRPIRAKPVPHQGVPFMPKLSRKSTVLKPFTFDERDKETIAKKEEKFQEEIKLASRVPVFKAQLLPPESITGVPEKQVKPSTVLAPFKMLIDNRGEEKAEKWKKQVEDELKQQKEARVFKAQPCSVPYKKPFTVKPSHRALTNITAIELNTDRRACQREEMEKVKKSKQVEIEAITLEKTQEQLHMEKLAILKFRKEIVHKAQPVKKFKPFAVKPSDADLTEPHSPRFSTRLRSNRT